MNKLQHNRLLMYQAVKSVITRYQSDWKSLKSFAAIVVLFQELNSKIIELIGKQEDNSKGVTIEKKVVEQKLIEQTLVLIKSITVYAVQQNQLQLKSKVSFTVSDLTRARNNDLLVISMTIHQEAMVIVDQLADYGISNDDLKGFEILINDFETMLSAPRDTISQGALATAQLKEVFKQTHDLLIHEMDPLMVHFKEKEFHKAYFNARNIVDYGKRKKKEVIETDNLLKD